MKLYESLHSILQLMWIRVRTLLLIFRPIPANTNKKLLYIRLYVVSIFIYFIILLYHYRLILEPDEDDEPVSWKPHKRKSGNETSESRYLKQPRMSQ